MNKNYILAGVIIVILGFGIYYLSNKNSKVQVKGFPTVQNDQVGTSTPVKKADASNDNVKVLGKSVEGRDITAFNYGTGEKNILFIGGIHGGYSWNTTLTAYELMAYLRANPDVIPKNITVTVVPVMNPDGLSKVVPNINKFNASVVDASTTLQVAGRFNANKVDLSRNFDCQWQADAKWVNKTVSGGSSAFSEPESLAIKNFIEATKPSAVVVWYSSAGGVYASSCGGEVSPETLAITDLYAKAAGYTSNKTFDYYETSGDLPNWLAKINIPSISVLLTDHVGTDWNKNQKAVTALLEYYSK